MQNAASQLRNFRDFGVTASTAQTPLPGGMLFRSGHLARLDEASRTELARRPWRLVIDLRYPDEQARDPSPWPADGTMTCLRIGGGSSREAPHFEMFVRARGAAGILDEVYGSFYRELPFDPLYRAFFADAIRQIGSVGGPILIHCTAGKDRTGIFVALLLELLGVERDLIRADYLRSTDIVTAEFVEAFARQIFETSGERPSEPELRAMLAVAPAYIDAALGAVLDSHGSAREYFEASGLESAEIDAAIMQVERARHAG